MALHADDVPVLEGWVPLAEAADRMKMSKNGLRRRVFDYGEFPGVKKIALGGNNWMFLLPEKLVDAAVEVELREREHFQTVRQPQIIERKARSARRQRILDWAHAKGHETGHMGRLPDALIAAYVQEHPDDKE